jgi:hypothetical protein
MYEKFLSLKGLDINFYLKIALQQQLSYINLTPLQNQIDNLGRVVNSQQNFVSGKNSLLKIFQYKYSTNILFVYFLKY